MLKKLHHVGYRCRDAAETVDFYANGIGLKFAAAMIDHVPSTGTRPRNNNVFFELEDGSYLCFFEILGSTDPFVPVPQDWAQHLALEVRDEARAEEIAARLRQRGVQITGPVAHAELARSWYFNDPSGHLMEMLVKPPVAQTTKWQEMHDTAPANMVRWAEIKKNLRTSP